MMQQVGLSLFLFGLLLVSGLAFITQNPAVFSSKRSHLWSSHLTSSENLLEAIRAKDDDRTAIAIEQLEASSSQKAEEVDFDRLIGLYEVSYVKTKNPKDNPVGGKWTRKNGIAQRLLRTRRTFQHILPPNTTGIGKSLGEGREVIGEAVNVVYLEALGGLVRLSVILRGDAIPLSLEERTNTTRVVQPLSALAVKAHFDPPRIVVGKNGRLLNINVGPKTSVLLDTLYCDNKLRLGMGGTSGSRFVFKRCSDDDKEANEFLTLLVRSMKKRNVLACIGGISTLSVALAIRGYLRVLNGPLAVMALSLGVVIAFSGGGIEQDDMGVSMRKEGQASAKSTS